MKASYKELTLTRFDLHLRSTHKKILYFSHVNTGYFIVAPSLSAVRVKSLVVSTFKDISRSCSCTKETKIQVLKFSNMTTTVERLKTNTQTRDFSDEFSFKET